MFSKIRARGFRSIVVLLGVISLMLPAVAVMAAVGTWNQVGGDIDGEAAEDLSGWSVAMNSSGDAVIIGATGSDDNGNNSGHARVYTFDGSAWNQVGGDIDGEASSDFSGWSVAMNDSGDTVVIGARFNDGNGINSGHARVYEFVGSTWNQVGGDIDGEASSDFSGWSVAMDGEGDTVVIGAILNDGNGGNSGHARIYDFDGTAWTQVGADIDGETGIDFSGYSVAMNDSGDTVVIGAVFNDGNGGNSGHARVYSFDGAAWNQVGDDIDGEAIGDQSGYSVAMNSSGNTIIVGARFNDGTDVDAGHARVFRFDDSTWNQMGEDIDGEANSDFSGHSVAMDASGDTVIVGAIFNGGNGIGAGHARVYSFDGAAWNQVGDDIDGEAAGDQSGHSVAMNGSGDTVVVGAVFNDGNGLDSGHARVYSFTTNQPPTADAGGPYVVAVNSQVVFDGSGSSDPDGDPLTTSWTAAGGTVAGDTFTAGAAPGIYEVCLTVNDGTVDSAPDCTTVVVYDADGGFVTGGGWIDSPAGAYVADPGMTGRVDFGFVSKYKKGANVPGGGTEFFFEAGELDFRSTSYEWLVIEGQNQAKYRGVGTLNGGGNYGFMVTAVDNGKSGDTFRIKIWDEDAGDAVVYDNQLGGDDAGYSGTVIGAGNIKVNTK